MNILQHPLLQSIAQNKIRVTVEQHNFGDEARPKMEPCVIIEGFSKSGTVMLFTDSGGVVKALARCSELTVIEDFDDLVALAYDWWYRYHDRTPFETPHIMWLPHFLSRGWLEEVKTVTYKAIK